MKPKQTNAETLAKAIEAAKTCKDCKRMKPRRCPRHKAYVPVGTLPAKLKGA